MIFRLQCFYTPLAATRLRQLTEGRRTRRQRSAEADFDCTLTVLIRFFRFSPDLTLAAHSQTLSSQPPWHPLSLPPSPSPLPCQPSLHQSTLPYLHPPLRRHIDQLLRPSVFPNLPHQLIHLPVSHLIRSLRTVLLVIRLVNNWVPRLEVRVRLVVEEEGRNNRCGWKDWILTPCLMVLVVVQEEVEE